MKIPSGNLNVNFSGLFNHGLEKFQLYNNASKFSFFWVKKYFMTLLITYNSHKVFFNEKFPNVWSHFISEAAFNTLKKKYQLFITVLKLEFEITNFPANSCGPEHVTSLIQVELTPVESQASSQSHSNAFPDSKIEFLSQTLIFLWIL